LSGRIGGLQALAPVAALVAAMISIQVGAATAQSLFPLIGAQGATALRVALAAVILLAIRRPRLAGLTLVQARAILAYGAALGAMNLLFYLSLRTIPLGVAVAVEFVGPLALAAFSNRSRTDLAWLALAAAGLAALAPIGRTGGVLDPVGLALAAGAGLFWALYILFGQKAGAAAPGAATALGMVVAAVLVFPFGLAHAGAALFSPVVLPTALAVAVLSSALPYSLEMFALTRLPKASFGILMSLEPALGGLSGWLILNQHLTPRQGLAIGCIILASAGVTASLYRAKTANAVLPD
jgi:inner membrane transporter RhtA